MSKLRFKKILGTFHVALYLFFIINSVNAIRKNRHNSRFRRETRPAIFYADKHHKLNLRFAGHDHTVMESSKLKVWSVKSTLGTTPNYSYHEFGDAEKILEKYRLYEDLDKRATLLAYYEDGYIYYDGVIGESGESTPIKHAKENWWNENAIDEKRVVKPPTDKPMYYDVPGGHDPHRPYFTNEKSDEPVDVMYPKILLAVDYSLYKKLGSSFAETLEYLYIYWSGVNMRFKEIEWPKVNIKITGIIIAEDENAMHYVNEAYNRDRQTINGQKVMQKMIPYFQQPFKNETKFYDYDTTVVMSALDSGALLGSAFVGQICNPELNVVFIHDDASYNGIATGTHEIGHHIGIEHDGELDKNKEKKKCSEQTIPKDFGTIMSRSADFARKKLIWSECSKQSLAKFAWLKAAECLKHRHRRQI